MVLFDYNTDIDPSWKMNAPKSWGIPVHESGETYLPDFILEHSDDLATTQRRLWRIYFQLMFNLAAGFAFSINMKMAAGMLRYRWNTLSAWCCFIPSLFGFLLAVFYSLALFSAYFNCRKMIWYIGLGITVSIFCSSAILLQKAYLVLFRRRSILVVGGLFMLPQLSFFAIVMFFCAVTLDDVTGCVIHYPRFLPWYWLAASAPINVFFSAIFSYVAYKQYRQHGSDAWRRLARDGIQTMCLVVLCNIICASCIILKVGGNYSEFFFLADWSITSTVLVHHCSQMRKASTVARSVGSSGSWKSKQTIKSIAIPTTRGADHY
ncbi:hypothetical protein BDF22DRAFT_695126 [Syncephalis plumigaleata]|nr:hypothetical protein BDF22DRAFT_695126 [Syncephalis plumigaleata]